MIFERLFRILTFVFFLVGCAPRSLATAEMTYSGPMLLNVAVEPVELPGLEALVDLFNQEHPRNPVSIVNFASQADLSAALEKTKTQNSADSPLISPQIFLLDYRIVPTFAAQQEIYPLDGFLEASPLIKLADFYPVAMDAYRWNGMQYCLPQSSSSIVVYYNRTMFEKTGLPEPKEGWGLDEFLAAAKKLTRDQNGDGINDQFGLGLQPGLASLTPFIWMNGVDIVNDRTAPIKLSFDLPEAKEALRWFINLQLESKVTPGQEQEELVNSASRFILGNVAMYIGGRSATPTFRTISSFSWDVAPLPVGIQSASLLESSGYCIASRSETIKPAWAFVEFAAGPIGQSIAASSGSFVPALRKIAESAVFLQGEKLPGNSQVWLDAQTYLKHFPAVPHWMEIESIYNNNIANAFYGKIVLEEAVQSAATSSAVLFVTNK